MKQVTVDNFEEETKGMPLLLRALYAAKLGLQYKAVSEARDALQKVEALKQVADHG